MTETDAPRQANMFAAMKRSARLLFVASTIMLAACQSIVPKGPGPAQPTGPAKPTGPEVTQGLPTDTARHRVALLVPTSGPNAGVGQSIANATTLALMDIKTDKVRITTYDTATGAAAAANRALADGNRLILGPLLADDARIVGPIAAKANVPVISFSNDTSVAGSNIWRARRQCAAPRGRTGRRHGRVDADLRPHPRLDHRRGQEIAGIVQL